MSVAILTDSAASLPPAMAADHGVTLVPLLLTIGGRTYDDGELTLAEVLSRLDEGVSTSGPTPGSIARAAERSLETHDEVLVLTIAGTMSSTCEAARAAVALVHGPVEVVDTATAAGAQGLVVLAAARMATAQAPMSDVVIEAKRAVDAVRLVAAVGSMDRLVQSGRVPGIAGWAADRLGVNPLFQFRAGSVQRLRPAFSRQAALDRLVDRCRTVEPGAALHVAAMHAEAEQEAIGLLERVQAEVEPATAFLAEFSAVMVTHTGPGLVGLAWWWDSPE